ncbi:MAG TPA: APC family permease [Thermomicrobiales bacterium]|nr:APC family permease [Thermomicrobiales bacterium]
MAEERIGSDTGREPGAGQLRRALGLPQVLASGVGIIVGAGIYALLAPATALAGARVWQAFLLSAGLSLMTALSYAELSSMFPQASSEFAYTRQVFPDGVAFIVSWLMATGMMVGAATISLGFAGYLGAFIDLDLRLGALALLVVVTVIALGGIERSGRLTIVLSLIQVGGLAAVIVIGVPHLGDVDLTRGPGASGILAAASLVFFAFIGFDDVATLAEETTNPTRTIPLALLLSLGISAALYIGVAVAAVSVLGVAGVATSSRPIADVFAHVAGERGGQLLAAVALVATTNTALQTITASSRIVFGVAASGNLPGGLARIWKRTGAPLPAILVSALIAGAFVFGHDLRLVASVTDAALFVVFVIINVVVIALRVRQPDRERPFRSPGAIGRVPILPILAIGSTILLFSALERQAVLLAGGLAALGLLVYLALAAANRSVAPSP